MSPATRWRSRLAALVLIAACGGTPHASAGRSASKGRGASHAQTKGAAKPQASDPGAARRGDSDPPAKAADPPATAADPPATATEGTKPAATEAGDDEPRVVGAVQRGESVWYGSDWHGKPTASGERFNKRKMTAAHRTLPMGAMVRVTSEHNGNSVTVRINDRGPYGKRRERIIDVSEAAARVLGIIDAGSGPVSIEVLSLPAPRKDKAR